MTYEEKLEFRKVISQLLADAGLNQATLKQMVEDEVKNKVARAVQQTIDKLDKEAYCSENYIEMLVKDFITRVYLNSNNFDYIVKEAIKNKIVEVTIKDVKLEPSFNIENLKNL